MITQYEKRNGIIMQVSYAGSAVAPPDATVLPADGVEVLAYLAAAEVDKLQAQQDATQAETLKAYADLTPLFGFIASKGYTSLSDAMLVVLADLPQKVD